MNKGRFYILEDIVLCCAVIILSLLLDVNKSYIIRILACIASLCILILLFTVVDRKISKKICLYRVDIKLLTHGHCKV